MTGVSKGQCGWSTVSKGKNMMDKVRGQETGTTSGAYQTIYKDFIFYKEREESPQLLKEGP